MSPYSPDCRINIYLILPNHSVVQRAFKLRPCRPRLYVRVSKSIRLGFNSADFVYAINFGKAVFSMFPMVIELLPKTLDSFAAPDKFVFDRLSC